MKDSILRPKADATSLCPACERYIGPAPTCHYCDADAATTPAIRWLRRSCIVFSILGLTFLHRMSVLREIQEIDPADIRPTMNFALIRMRGVVPRPTYVPRSSSVPDYLSFTLQHGSRQVRVRVYGRAAAELIANGDVPRQGDRVVVTGSLRISANEEPKIILNHADGLHIVRTSRASRSSTGKEED